MDHNYDDTELSPDEAVAEVEAVLNAVRRTTISSALTAGASASRTNSVLHHRRRSSLVSGGRRVSGWDLDISYNEMKHLFLLDAELRHDAAHTRRSSVSLLKDVSDRWIDDEHLEEERCHAVLSRMRTLTCVAALGGFLSGYNTGVISGALLPLKRVFSLSPEQEESIVSATIFFAFVASLLGGSINTIIGRRFTIMAAASIFTVGGFVLFAAQSYTMLLVGEILLGIGIGIESLTSPIYIAEVSKPTIRGMLVSAYALMMSFGQFFAGIVDGVAGAFDSGWRAMFGLASIPGAIMFLGFSGLPESPSWLLHNGKKAEAQDVLRTVRDSEEDVQREIQEIQQTMEAEEPNSASLWSILRSRATRRALVVGCSLMVLQQFCGANVVMYYSATIYRMSGFGELTAIWLSAFTALAQLRGLAMSVVLVETAGRRPLLLASLSGVAICLFGLGGSFYLARVYSEEVDQTASDELCMAQHAIVWDGVTRYAYDCVNVQGCGFCGGACLQGTESSPSNGAPLCPHDSEWEFGIAQTPAWVGWLPVVFMVSYLILFGVGVAGLPWTINSEIYPIHFRSTAVAISTGTNWLCNLLISSTFLSISSPSVLTLYGSFWLYCLISVLGVMWLYFRLPETNGLCIDEIERTFDPDTERRKEVGDGSYGECKNQSSADSNKKTCLYGATS